MSIRKCFSWQGSAIVSMLLLATTQPLAAETHPRRRSQADGQLYPYVVGFSRSES